MNTPDTQTALTDAQKIQRLAEFMGWKKEVLRKLANGLGEPRDAWFSDNPRRREYWCDEWTPLTDWGHWRQVEVEACRNHRLWHEFMHRLGINTTGTSVPSDCTKMYSRSILVVRVDALLAALDSLLP